MDKACLVVDGEPQAPRMVRLISEAGLPVTVLGRKPIEGASFLEDAEEFGGPLAALGRFVPSARLVFVTSCDLPAFSAQVVQVLRSEIGESQAAVPLVAGFRQPLCALYRPAAFASARMLAKAGERRVMRWLDPLEVREIALPNPLWATSANTPAEWEALVSGR